MKRKPIKIDWDELEDAFTNPEEDVVFFLDRVTGRIVLEGEGEEDDLDDDDAAYDLQAQSAAPPPRNDPTRAYVRSPDALKKIEWMKEFVAEHRIDKATMARLADALEAEDAPAALSEVLNQVPEVREDWYLYRTTRLRRMIEDWLKSNGIETVDSPTWSS